MARIEWTPRKQRTRQHVIADQSINYVEPAVAFLQLKASEALARSGSHYVYDLDIRDYNLWMLEEMPVILILFDASRRRAYWLPVQRYFGEEVARRPKKGAKSIRVGLSQPGPFPSCSRGRCRGGGVRFAQQFAQKLPVEPFELSTPRQTRGDFLRHSVQRGGQWRTVYGGKAPNFRR